jgi:outer membrane protein OmpA-like peptidoglycan-associated protein
MRRLRVLGVLMLAACDRGETHAPAVQAAPVPVSVAAPVVTDRDGDGVVDELDRCPDESGVPESGCPDLDLDKDGVDNANDRCPDVAEIVNGIEDRDGCPDEVPPEVRGLVGPIAGVVFDFNKATFKPQSFAALDRIVEILLRYPEVRIEVSGHVDSKGSDDFARRARTAGRRAEAVQRYLVTQGVAGERVVTRDAHDEEPIADNKTAEGRARNRRVEIKLLAP